MAVTLPNYRGTAGWLDGLGDAATRANAAGLTIENYRDTNSLAQFYTHNAVKYLTVVIQFNHNRKPAQACHVHLHYTPMVAPTDVGGEDVYFYYEYYWQGIAGTIPAIASWVTGNTTLHVDAGDEFQHLTFEIVDPAAPGTESPSSLLIFTLARLGTDPNDTYDTAKADHTPAANLCVWYIDAHFIADRVGSLQEYND